MAIRAHDFALANLGNQSVCGHSPSPHSDREPTFELWQVVELHYIVRVLDGAVGTWTILGITHKLDPIIAVNPHVLVVLMPFLLQADFYARSALTSKRMATDDLVMAFSTDKSHALISIFARTYSARLILKYTPAAWSSSVSPRRYWKKCRAADSRAR